jgi:ubiquinone/menaquinone biosynthesis C-methylase UbiE
VLSGSSKLDLQVPRDRLTTFDPQLIAKYQRRFPDGAFNVAICNSDLSHFSRPEAAVIECVRILRALVHRVAGEPGRGRLAAAEPLRFRACHSSIMPASSTQQKPEQIRAIFFHPWG